MAFQEIVDIKAKVDESALKTFEAKVAKLKSQLSEGWNEGTHNSLKQFQSSFDKMIEPYRKLKGQLGNALAEKDIERVKELASQLKQVQTIASEYKSIMQTAKDEGFVQGYDYASEVKKIEALQNDINKVARKANNQIIAETNKAERAAIAEANKAAIAETNKAERAAIAEANKAAIAEAKESAKSISKLMSAIGKSFTETFKTSYKVISKYFGLLKKGFSSIFNLIKKGFSGSDNQKNPLMSLFKKGLTFYGIKHLIRQMHSFIQETLNLEGVANTTFGSYNANIASVKNNLREIGTIGATGLIQALTPVVSLLNSISYYALQATYAIADLLGFGGSAREAVAGYNAQAEAISGVGSAAKSASDNLQGFDKLNNITSDKGGGGGGVGSALKDIKAEPKKLKFLEDLKELLTDKKWKQAGSYVASAINKVNEALYTKLTNPNNIKKVHKFNNALTDFIDGLLDVDFNLIGKNIGAGLNLITSSILDLYNQLSGKGILKKVGQNIYNFFDGILTETNWKELGQTFSVKFRSIFDVLSGFADEAKDGNLGVKVGTAIKDFINGAIEMLFGNGGAEEIGRTIGELINQGLVALGTMFEPDENGETIGHKLGTGLVTIINNAVHEIKPQDLSKAFSGLLDNIADFFLAFDDMDTSAVAKGIYTSINDAVEGGQVSKLVSGITTFLTKFVDLLGQVILGIDWLPFIGAVLTGIVDGLSNGITAEGLTGIAEAFGVIFGVKLIAKTFLSKMGLTSLANATVGELASAINSEANASTLAGSTTSGLGGLLNKATTLAAGMMVVSIGDAVVSAYNDTMNEIQQYEDIVTAYLNFDTSAVDANFSKISENFSSLEEQITAVESVAGKFNKAVINTDGWDNKTKTVEYLRGYLEDLRDAGFEGTTSFEELEKAIRNWDEDISKTSGAKEQTSAIGAIISAAQDCDIIINENRKAIQELNAEDLTEISRNYGDFKVGMKFTPEELRGIADTARRGGKQTADGFIYELNDTVDKDTTMKSTLSSQVKDATDSVKSDAKTDGEEIGKNIVEGQKQGIENNKQSVFTVMKGLAQSCLSAVKGLFGINSPSRVFRDEIGKNLILGMVEGITDEELAVTDAMADIQTAMMQPFQTRDMSQYFDFSGIPRSIAINPSVNKARLESGLAMEGSTQGILGSLGMLNHNTNRGRVQVAVYLDANNKLGDFILDTVNGQVVKGGNF